MEYSFDSGDGGAAEVQRRVVEAILEPLSDGKLQSKGSGSFAPIDGTNSVDDFENNGDCVAVVPGQERTEFSVIQDFDASDAILWNKPEMGSQVVVEKASAACQEQVSGKCSTKCATVLQVIDGAQLIESSVLGNEKIDSDGNGSKGYMKQHELKEKKEKRSRRRGGKARKSNEILSCYFNERKEKTGLQYSREEMEALRFEKLEEQKKKWVEVYCGMSATVVKEYDGLAGLDKIPRKDSVPSFDFDPRPQYQKPANFGEECPYSADNHLSSFVPISDETEFSVLEEGDLSEDDGSDDDYDSIQRPVFMVTGEPDFDSGPPQDGLEYLRRVRWESARIPKVKVSAKVNKIKEQSPYMPQIPDVMKCPDNLLPLKDWEDSFLDDFSELRQAFSQLDLGGSSAIKLQSVHEEHTLDQMIESNALNKIVSLTSVDDSSPSDASCELENSNAKSNPHSTTVDRPTLSSIMKMDAAARTSMLKRRISSIENMSRISHNESLWLFALCVAVDCPLIADTSAAIRSLLRKCASLRAAKTEVDDEVIILNILVTISGRYFGQLER